jgi:hypothetical protein
MSKKVVILIDGQNLFYGLKQLGLKESGDYDYAEAINYVKNNMTKVHIVKLHKGFPPKNRSMSRDLSDLADKVIDLYEADIRSNYLKRAISNNINGVN